MCYGPPTAQHWAPEPAADPGRHRLEARALDAVDELIGQPQARLHQIADEAARILDALDGSGDLAVDTDERSADEIAAEILRRTGWPSQRR